MVKIRLKRLGYKRNPIFRIIVINSCEKREGRPVQELGVYNPKRKELRLNKVAALEWIKKGAQPTDTVKYLIENSDENGNLIRKKLEETKLSKKEQAKKAQEIKSGAEDTAKEENTPKEEVALADEA